MTNEGDNPMIQKDLRQASLLRLRGWPEIEKLLDLIGEYGAAEYVLALRNKEADFEFTLELARAERASKEAWRRIEAYLEAHAVVGGRQRRKLNFREVLGVLAK